MSRFDKEFRTVKVGYTDEPQGGKMAIAGIDLGDHGNAIEVYGGTVEEAEGRRDRLLFLLMQSQLQDKTDEI